LAAIILLETCVKQTVHGLLKVNARRPIEGLCANDRNARLLKLALTGLRTRGFCGSDHCPRVSESFDSLNLALITESDI